MELLKINLNLLILVILFQGFIQYQLAELFVIM
jgi:hypothetical protein